MSHARDICDDFSARFFNAEIPNSGEFDQYLSSRADLGANCLLLLKDLSSSAETEGFSGKKALSLEGDLSGELLADKRNKLPLLLLSSLGALYCQSGGSGDLLRGPSGRVVGVGLEAVGVDTITLTGTGI